MFVSDLITSNSSIRLISPDMDRDAPLSVRWLAGDSGRDSLRLMGVAPKDNRPGTLAGERRRVQDFLERTDQYNWMIESSGHVIGSVWADLNPTPHLDAPSVHIMIGDASARRAGAGTAAFAAVIDFLKSQGYNQIFSRHLLENTASARLQTKLGFTKSGEPYTDQDGLSFQNLVLK